MAKLPWNLFQNHPPLLLSEVSRSSGSQNKSAHEKTPHGQSRAACSHRKPFNRSIGDPRTLIHQKPHFQYCRAGSISLADANNQAEKFTQPHKTILTDQSGSGCNSSPSCRSRSNPGTPAASLDKESCPMRYRPPFPPRAGPRSRPASRADDTSDAWPSSSTCPGGCRSPSC